MIGRMTTLSSTSGDLHPQVRRVLQALRANRIPGWQFAGHHLGISFEDVSMDSSRLAMPVGEHCTGSDGDVSILAVCVLADVALTAALRKRSGASARTVTVAIRLSFAPFTGARHLTARAERSMALDGGAMPLAVNALTISDGDRVCCTGEATFAILQDRKGTSPHPMPRVNMVESLPPMPVDELTPPEADVLKRAYMATAEQAGSHSFLERFWGITPETKDAWVESHLQRGIHIANRAGDAQGGVLLGLAAQTSLAALPAGWRLVDLSAQFVATASGQCVHARAQPIRTGRSLAFIDCGIVDESGQSVLRTQATLAKL
jgi:acyl-coenzyme A thioesterase PaaI-like protein